MLDPKYLDAMKRFEGYASRSAWDYAQFTNGYGTRAHYEGECIDQAEAEQRFIDEVSRAYTLVDRFAPNLHEGTKAALTSLTFNAGTSWMTSGLGTAIKSGDIDGAKRIFLDYNKADGKVLPGLVSRRRSEQSWFCNMDVKSPAEVTATSDQQARAAGAAAQSGTASLLNWLVHGADVPNESQSFQYQAPGHGYQSADAASERRQVHQTAVNPAVLGFSSLIALIMSSPLLSTFQRGTEDDGQGHKPRIG